MHHIATACGITLQQASYRYGMQRSVAACVITELLHAKCPYSMRRFTTACAIALPHAKSPCNVHRIATIYTLALLNA